MRPLKNNNGFTLIELIIALTISIIVISSISLFFISNYKLFFRADDQITAQDEARKAMSYIIDKVIQTKGINKVQDKSSSFIENTTGIHDVSWIEFKNDPDNLVFEFKNGAISYIDSYGIHELANHIKAFQIEPISSDYSNCKGIEIIITVGIDSNNGNYDITISDQVYFRNKK